ncbi:MAG: macro domain-containing protein [Candidatus Babeliaceae bacterium]|nr:macro domain-containing protein [Candidatus Babeliaceae bacterium]
MKKISAHIVSTLFLLLASFSDAKNELQRLSSALRTIAQPPSKVTQISNGTYKLISTDKKKVTVTFKTGDMLEEGAEAVVDAANATLGAGGGVSELLKNKAIEYAQAKGKNISNMISYWNQGKPHDFSLGKAWLNPNQYVRVYDKNKKNIMRIIHTVGPNCSNNDDANKVYDAYKNSVIEARKNNIKSIAFPLISIGIFKCPANKITSLAVNAIFDEILSGGGAGSLSKISVVAYGSNKTNEKLLISAAEKYRKGR